jgi:large subunit ribosomal protein L9
MLPLIKERIVKVIFIDDVPNVARVGQTKEVANGYARNYLFPRKLAVLADSQAAAAVDAHLKKLVKQHAVEEAQMAELAKKINGTEITLRAKVGENDKLYGSITAADIAEALSKAAGVLIDKKNVAIAEPIKVAGVCDVTIKFMREITAVIKACVVDENATDEMIAEAKAKKAEAKKEKAEAAAEPKKPKAVKAADASEKAEAEGEPKKEKAEKSVAEKKEKKPKAAKEEKPAAEPVAEIKAASEKAAPEKPAKEKKAKAEKAVKEEKPAVEEKAEKAAAEKPAKEKKAKSAKEEKAAIAEEPVSEKKEKKPKAKAKKED